MRRVGACAAVATLATVLAACSVAGPRVTPTPSPTSHPAMTMACVQNTPQACDDLLGEALSQLAIRMEDVAAARVIFAALHCPRPTACPAPSSRSWFVFVWRWDDPKTYVAELTRDVSLWVDGPQPSQRFLQ